jgi:hypothetical protein
MPRHLTSEPTCSQMPRYLTSDSQGSQMPLHLTSDTQDYISILRTIASLLERSEVF